MRPRRAAAFEQLTTQQRRYLETGDRDGGAGFGFLLWSFDDDAVAETWRTVGPDLTLEWAIRRPGLRPALWWRLTAPQVPIANVKQAGPDDLAAQRRRLGGIGTPQYECLNVAPRFAFGIPSDWVSSFDEAYYRGIAVDIHGRPIAIEFRKADFRGVAPRADDPPIFESQATYLERFGLLFDGEKDRITAAGWNPEAIAIPSDAGPDVRQQFPSPHASRIFDKFERPR
jgi:hypothetical protein